MSDVITLHRARMPRRVDLPRDLAQARVAQEPPVRPAPAGAMLAWQP